MHFEMYDAETEQDIELFQGMGFDQFILTRHDLAPFADQRGLRVVLANWWKTDATWSDIEPVLDTAKTLSHLVSINMMDEPCIWDFEHCKPPVYRKIRRWIRSAGVELPLSITIYGPDHNWPVDRSRVYLDYLKSVDLMRMTCYPLVAGRPLDTVPLWIQQARLLMRANRTPRPLTVVLQSWRDLTNSVPMPPISKLRVMAHAAILTGISTLSFFSYNQAVWTSTPGFMTDFQAMMRELILLAHDVSGGRFSYVLGGDGLFQSEVRKQGQTTCYTVNLTEDAIGAIGPLAVVRSSGRCPRAEHIGSASSSTTVSGSGG